MKTMICFIILISTLLGAEVDLKLFDKNEKNYLEQIEKSILQSEKEKKKDNEIIKSEKIHLERLKQALSTPVSNEAFENFSLKKSPIVLEDALNTIAYLGNTKIKIKSQTSTLIDLQNKLSALKKLIDNITEEQKSMLMTYQLQFAYYKVLTTNLQEKLNQYAISEKEVYQRLLNVLGEIQVTSIEKIDAEIQKIDSRIKRVLEEKATNEIKLEKEKIEDNKYNIQTLDSNIEKLEVFYQNELKAFIKLKQKKMLLFLLEGEEKEFLTLHSNIGKLIVSFSDTNRALHEEEQKLFKDIAIKKFGNVKFLITTSLTKTEGYLTKVSDIFTTTLFVFSEKPINLISIIKALIIVCMGFLLGNFYKKWVYKVSKNWSNMSQMSLKLSSNIGYYIILFITIIIAISSLGIDLSSLSLIAGALSIGIGFGLQTVVSNLIAGIILMSERTIRIGDIIEITPELKGTVTDIRIRSTTIKTFDNIDIIIPNSSFIQNNVINWTLDDPTRRLHIPFGVAYGTNIEELKTILIKELMESTLTFIKEDKDKQPEIRLELMNASSVDFELLVWVKANDKVKPNALKSDFLQLIYTALYKYNIPIPFPQLDLHVKELTTSKAIKNED